MAIRAMSANRTPKVLYLPGCSADTSAVPARNRRRARRVLWWLARALGWVCVVVIALAVWIGYRLVRFALRTSAGV